MLILFLFLIPFAYAEGYDFEEITFTHTPTVCTLTPNDPLISESVKSQYLKGVYDAVMEWQYGLMKHAKIPKNWAIDYQVDGKDCDVVIEFKRFFDDETIPYHNDILGVYYDGKIELFFQEYTTCGEQGQTKCYRNDVIPATELTQTAKHEFGHALGLGHYDGSYDNLGASSIMNPQTNRINDQNKIRDIDTQTLLYLYGNDGFKQKKLSIEKPIITAPIIPDWIKNNARWWADGKISNTEYLNALQYLIDQGILKIR